jgi:cupin 2 domain-containing protein
MNTSVANNIYSEIPNQLPAEIVECILKKENIVIERIISNGHITTAGQWYDQANDEWVILLQGQAILLFEEHQKQVTLNPGDYLLIPAHARHRVEWTVPEFSTIWVAIHF